MTMFNSAHHNHKIPDTTQLAHCDIYPLTSKWHNVTLRVMSDSATKPAPIFDQIDYHDHFQVSGGTERFDDIDEFTRTFFLNQPSWLTRVSAGIGKQQVRPLVKNATFAEGSSVGSWQIYERSDNSITFGQDMRIMAYRVIYTWIDDNTIDAQTEVTQASRWIGPLYWGIASRLHMRFLPMMLRNAAGHGSKVSNMLA